MARICGDFKKSRVYFNQARLWAGDIFDQANPDSGIYYIILYLAILFNLIS